MIELIKGSIFDSKCDLIVIPANTDGGVAPHFAEFLNESNLLSPKRKMGLGEVRMYERFSSQFTIANYIAIVASVKNGVNTTKDIMRQAFINILKLSSLNNIRTINMPLLGTGAGRLSEVQCFEVAKEVFESEKSINVKIFAFAEEHFRNISINFLEEKIENIKNPRVFVSYASANAENAKWTQKLVDILRENGVDARLDKYILKPGIDLPQWMTNEIIQADKVLLICDNFYSQKSNIRSGGVGWETMIIQGDMLWTQNDGKYIAIAREQDIDKSIPLFMKSKYALHWSSNEISNENVEELLTIIFDCDIEPELGRIPDYITKYKRKKAKKLVEAV